MHSSVKASDFFTLPASLARFANFFPADAAPWEWLPRIAEALASLPTPEPLPATLPAGVHISGKVWLHSTVRLPTHATIIGPVWLGPDSEIRPGAFIRGNVITGAGCVLGNSCEYKNALLLDGVQTPHYNYVGDSLLGNRAHLGAGAICSNLRLDQREVIVRLADGKRAATGLRKFGAVVGDGAEVGCNAVLNPGTLLGQRALVSPCMAFSGYLASNTLARSQTSIATQPRHD